MRDTRIFQFIIIFGFMVSNLSCEKDEISSKLSGTWVEVTNRYDTIDFESWSSEDVFVVRRGYEFHSGYILPKHGSGVYRYKLNSDSIKINNMLWSCLCYPSYYFHMDGANHRFIIGNFYDTTLAAAQPLSFIRIK